MGDFLPKIGLTGLFGGVSPELSTLTAPGSRLWSVGVDASGPLFQAGLLAGQYRQARAFWDEARLEYQQTVLQAFHEVSGQLYTRQKYDEARLQQARSVAAYQDAVLVATERYRAGHANYFEVLDAQQQLFPDRKRPRPHPAQPTPDHRPPLQIPRRRLEPARNAFPPIGSIAESAVIAVMSGI